MSAESKYKIPLLRVSRPVSACSRCRMSKIKCDGKLPACSACERSGRSGQCSNANDEFAKGKERSYVSSLEARVEKLEKQITQAKSRKASVTMLDSLPTQAAPSSHFHLGGHQQRTQRKEASDVNDLVSDFGFLSLNATARDFYGFTGEMSFARLVLSSASVQKMPVFTLEMLPPRYANTPLIQHYLENMFVLYPFLDESKLFGSLDAVYQDGGRYASPMDHWTIRLILAIATVSLSRQQGDTKYQNGVRHAALALERADMVVQPGSVQGIQAILLLAQYAMLDPLHFNSWYLVGAAARAMVDLGLHQDPQTNTQARDKELDLRTRVYHSIYALDRSVSMVYLRAFSFTDDSANVAPLSDQLSLSSVPMSPEKQLFLQRIDPAMHLTELRQLQSCSYQQLYQSSRQVREEPWPVTSTALMKFQIWDTKMPDTMKEPMRRLIRSDMLYSKILVLSAPSLRVPFFEYSTALIFDYATEYAENVLLIEERSTEFIYWTSHDLRRAAYVSRTFLDILDEGFSSLLSGITPRAPPDPEQSSALPSLRCRTPAQMARRVTSCLDSLYNILEYLGAKFGDLEPWEIHKARRIQILQNLRDYRARQIRYRGTTVQAP